MITQEYLKECLVYDPETGVFTWKERPREHFSSDRICNSWNTRYSNKQAGVIDARGYVKICIGSRAYKSHRLAWLYVYGTSPKKHIDHRNGIKTDNRIENLRDVDCVVNQQNRRKAQPNSKSGVLGAMMTPCGTYQVKIRINGKTISYGTYATAEEANRVYIEIKRKVHPGCTI